MRIGIYSPCKEVLSQQQKILEDFEQDACLGLELTCCDDYRELIRQVNAFPPDILAYHMDSPEAEGQLLRLTQIIPNCTVVIISDSICHAVFGYAIHAQNYLLTPIDPEAYLSVLIGLIREQMQKKDQYLPLKVNGVWSRLNMRHITYLESEGHSLIFHMEDGREFRTSAGFRQYQGLLELNSDFVRCHKSYMVNLRHVASWEMDAFTLTGGERVNISRPYWQSARSQFACYVTRPKPKSRNGGY